MYNVLVIVEESKNNLGCYAPDMPGACVSSGRTYEEIERNMYEALQLHIRGTLEDGLTIPEQPSIAVYMAVPVTKSDKIIAMYRFLVLLREEGEQWMARCTEMSDYDDLSDNDIVISGATHEVAERKMYVELQRQATERLAAGKEVPQYPSSAVYMLVPAMAAEKYEEALVAA